MKSSFIIITVIFFFACNSKTEKKQHLINNGDTTEIRLEDEIKIIIPTRGEKFDSCRHYTHIELWKGSAKVFQDSTENEYIFLCNSSYPTVRKLNGNRYEILIEKFDGPDINKTLAIYLKDDKYESEKLLPFFESAPEDIEGKKEYHGILNTIEGYRNDDSCYYNPVLYYEISKNGILLDTSVTKRKIKEVWGNFYGYEQSDKIILPCR
jgi:hypothetical protein